MGRASCVGWCELEALADLREADTAEGLRSLEPVCWFEEKELGMAE